MVLAPDSAAALQLGDGSLLSEGAVIIQYLADLNPQSMPPAGTLARYRLHLPKIPRNQALLF